MFGVEKNAKDAADKVLANLKASGAGDKQAGRIANRHENRAILNGNKWVEKNVGRD